MKLLGTAAFFLAVLCVCTVGGPMHSSPGTTSQTKQPTNTTNDSTTKQPPAVTTAASTSLNTTNTTQANGTLNENLAPAPTTKPSFSSMVSPERSTSSGISGLPTISPTNSTKAISESPKNSSGNQTQTGSDISYSNVILPIVITLIVITLSVFSLVALYKMCQKSTPERQENGAEQAQSDKEGVKLLSVKTTSPETVFVEVCDTYDVGFSLACASLSEPITPPPSGGVSHGRTTANLSVLLGLPFELGIYQNIKLLNR
ncbi:endomucin [Sylvia borin]